MPPGVISPEELRFSGNLLSPDSGTISLWWTNIDWDDRAIAGAWRELSADERARAARYDRMADRNRFVAGRACLRRILGHYLNVSASAVTFELGEFGKPRLGRKFSDHRLCFNLAHSRELAVLAVGIGCEIGVDVEYCQPNRRFLEIAHRMFAPEERRELEPLADEDQMAAFYRCWTRKEAYVKAIGAGLSCALDSFVVPLFGGDVPMVVRTAGAGDFRLFDVSPNPQFAAALAISGDSGTDLRVAQF
ncbi:MAG TPA: 4'-phosphopantetheinyl transferase superfamily protein [Chthoniobacterales bacterium]|nr:4'-phosphopantetheinyl transferase superfamily protein [Chthoniobacterales bacterium]